MESNSDKNTNNNFQGAKLGGGFAGRDYHGDVHHHYPNTHIPHVKV